MLHALNSSKSQALLHSLKVEGCQNNWQWSSGGPCERAWTVVEKENIFCLVTEKMESKDSGNKRWK